MSKFRRLILAPLVVMAFAAIATFAVTHRTEAAHDDSHNHQSCVVCLAYDGVSAGLLSADANLPIPAISRYVAEVANIYTRADAVDRAVCHSRAPPVLIAA